MLKNKRPVSPFQMNSNPPQTRSTLVLSALLNSAKQQWCLAANVMYLAIQVLAIGL